MNMYDKLENLGKSFDHDTWIAFVCDGKTGRIIEYGLTEAQAKDYQRIGAKNKIKVDIAMYSHEAEGIIFG